MKKRLVRIGLSLLVTVLIIAAVSWVIRPVQQLDMAYNPINWQTKIGSAFLQRGVVTLSETDLTHLLKQTIRTSARFRDVPITGAAVTLEPNRFLADFNLQKGIWAVGLEMEGTVHLQDRTLQIVPIGYKIGRIPVSPETFQRVLSFLGMENRIPLTFRLDSYVPSQVWLEQLKIEKKQLEVTLRPQLLP